MKTKDVISTYYVLGLIKRLKAHSYNHTVKKLYYLITIKDPCLYHKQVSYKKTKDILYKALIQTQSKFKREIKFLEKEMSLLHNQMQSEKGD